MITLNETKDKGKIEKERLCECACVGEDMKPKERSRYGSHLPFRIGANRVHTVSGECSVYNGFVYLFDTVFPVDRE